MTFKTRVILAADMEPGWPFFNGQTLQDAGQNILQFAGPTHLGHPLDRIYASGPMYGKCSAIKSSIKTKHSAVLANCETVTQRSLINDREVRSLRLRTPGNLSALHAFIMNHTWSFFTEDISVEQAFDDCYAFIDDSLIRFFPLRKISIKRKDPAYM